MKRKRLIWAFVAIIALAAVIGIDVLKEPGQAEEFEIAEEFELHPIIELPSIGPFDLSITKAVVYLWLTAAVLIVFALLVRRSLKRETPSRFRVMMELLYSLAHDGIVGAVMKSGRATWFPYIASAFFFVLTANLLGLIPLPLAEHNQFGFYTATANLYVTLALALCTFVFTHYAGLRQNGPRYFVNWAPSSAPPVLKQLIWVIHAVSEVFRLVSLAVRLFANMLAGHAILAVFFAMALIFQSYLAAVVLQGASVLIYMFEIFVAFIQAFIFAILSAVYISGALDQEH
ncbi:MAG: F0F1 ATP synthase subunit A [Actinobacteria bacterium]|nr:F0F1 ATP synthase subunit A [Actinomycetota bacterium]